MNDFLCVTNSLAVLETHFVDQGVWPQTQRHASASLGINGVNQHSQAQLYK